MSLEIYQGTVNRVVHDTERQTITKEFFQGSGVGRPFFDRIIAEAQSMRRLPYTPELFGFTDSTITMSFIDGEKSLDAHVDSLADDLRYNIYLESGQVLRSIHNTLKIPVPATYHSHRRKSMYELIAFSAEALQRKDINPIGLLQFLEDTYSESEIESAGITWNHGDYWLNNIIGRLKEKEFQTTGIIDWELAGQGSPYEDFAVVKISIEDQHEDSSEPFWNGYELRPKSHLLQNYSFMKVLEWMRYDDPLQNGDYSSNFYAQNFSKIRKAI